MYFVLSFVCSCDLKVEREIYTSRFMFMFLILVLALLLVLYVLDVAFCAWGSCCGVGSVWSEFGVCFCSWVVRIWLQKNWTVIQD